MAGKKEQQDRLVGMAKALKVMALTTIIAGVLAFGGYGWAIRFSSVHGVVEEKISEPHRYGDYILVINGEEWVPPRVVYNAAKVGSTIERPFAAPYILVDGERFIMWYRIPFAAIPAVLGLALVTAVGVAQTRDLKGR